MNTVIGLHERQTFIPAGAREILARLRAAGHEAFLVGGCVRDLLVGLTPKDFDIATAARPDQVRAVFPRAAGVGAHFGVMLVRVQSRVFEVATFRSDGRYLDGRRPESVTFTDARRDAGRRDFTINALFYDDQTDRVIDFVGGVPDLRARVIRAVGDARARFHEDRLRLLRAARFAVRFRFDIAHETAQAMRGEAPHIGEIAPERIGEELRLLFSAPDRARALDLLDDLGLLAALLPEVVALKGVEQPPCFHPEGDVFVHTRLVLERLEGRGSWLLALAALFHDIGKPSCFTRGPDRIRFDGHDEVSRTMSRAICRRLRFSNEQGARIETLVGDHLRFAQVSVMKKATLRRFVLREDFLDHLALHRADCLASHGRLEHYQACLDAMAALNVEERHHGAPRHRDRLLTGDHLVKAGYRPGPAFKTMLEAAYDAQLERRIATTDEALAFVAERFGSLGAGDPTGTGDPP